MRGQASPKERAPREGAVPSHLRGIISSGIIKVEGKNPHFDLRQYLYQIARVDFTLIDGLDALAVQTILSEIGLDAQSFPTLKHFCSWLTSVRRVVFRVKNCREKVKG